MTKLLALIVIAALASPSVSAAAQAQQAGPPPAASDSPSPDRPFEPINPDALPVDIDRIQRRLSRPPAIRPESSRPVFRAEVFGRNPTIDEILGPDWRKGPVPYGGMTHSEFLNIVTPKDVQGYAAFDNKQGMVVAATSFALQWAFRQAVKKLDDAKTARQKEAAEKEVSEALTALRRARQDAGLPDR
jgi:hypothetical protein